MEKRSFFDNNVKNGSNSFVHSTSISWMIIHFSVISLIIISGSLSITLIKGNSEASLENQDCKINPWPMYGGGPSHSRRLPFSLPDELILEKEWEKQIQGDISAYISLSENGTMYSLTRSGDLVAISSSGDLLWKYSGKGSTDGERPAIGPDGTIYFTTDAFQIYAIHPDGSLKWNKTIGYKVLSQCPPTVSKEGIVYVGTGDSILYAFHPDGTLIWKKYLDGCLYHAPALDENGNIYINSAGGSVFKLSPEGTLIWRRGIGDYSHCTLSLTDDNEVIVANDEGLLFSINEHGVIQWNFTIYTWEGPGIRQPIHRGIAIGSDGRIFFISSYVLYSLSKSGELLWKMDLGTGGELFVDNEGAVYINDGFFNKITPSGEKIPGSEINSHLPILIASENVILANVNSLLTKYRITESHRPVNIGSMIENESVKLFWDPPPDNTPEEILGYRIIRSDKGGSNSEVMEETEGTFFIDRPPEVDKYYSYQIITLTLYGESLPTFPWNVFYTYIEEIEILDLELLAEYTSSGIRLEFNSTRYQEISQIRIYRSDDDEDFHYIGSIYQPETEYHDLEVEYGSKYQYYCVGYSDYIGHSGMVENSQSNIAKIIYENPDENELMIIVVVAVISILVMSVLILGISIIVVLKKKTVEYRKTEYLKEP